MIDLAKERESWKDDAGDPRLAFDHGVKVGRELHVETVTLDGIAEMIQSFRYDILCSSGIEHLPPLAEQHALKMISYLELAQREATMASIHETQARVPPGTRGAI